MKCAFMNKECTDECMAKILDGNCRRLDAIHDIATGLTQIADQLPTLLSDDESIANAISELAESTQNIAAMIDAKAWDKRD